MKAIRVHAFGAPEVMQLEEVPDPTPGPGQVLVRVQAAGVNPVDTYLRTGTYSPSPTPPYTPGSDAAGVVEAVGPDVRGLVPGARVFTTGSVSGTYAEKALCLESQVVALPEGISFEQGAALGVPYGTAWRALFQRGRAQPAETVLVHGASGGVGIAAVQMAVAAGLKVFGTAGSPEGLRLVAEQGAQHVLDHGTPDYLATLLQQTGGKGVDLILEMLANVNLGKDLGVLAPGGRVVVVGSRGPVQINPRDLMSRDASVVGMRLFNASAFERESMYAGVCAGLARGVLRPVIFRRLPLAEAARAHHAIIEQKVAGKIVLVP